MKRSESGELLSAYVIRGSVEKIPLILAFVEKTGIETRANPDVYVREYLGFGIDDARELRERANTRAVAGDRRVFLIVTPSMTGDAQNALLKTLEEPPADAVFFFVLAAPEMLLATLLSRSHLLTFEAPMSRSNLDNDIGKFLAATLEKRIDMIKPLYAREDDEERDVRGAVAFLAELEQELSAKVDDEEVREGIRAIYLARKYLMDKGSLLKPLLEQVALLVPKA